MSIATSLIVLSILIFFHELGHYIAARLVGVKVEVFSIGFGSKIASFNRWGNEWRVALIPLGGYVKMKGQDDSDPTKKSYDKDSYNTKTPLQKIFILFMGPLANFATAYIFYILIALGGPNVLSPIVGDISPNSAASSAGILKGDTILSINDKAITSWEAMAKEIENAPSSLLFKIDRDGYIKNIIVEPKISQTKDIFGDIIEKKMIGISASGKTHKLEIGLDETLSYANNQMIFSSTMIFRGLKKLIFGEVPSSELGGVISIVKITSDASEAGWMSVLFVAALISVNLGVLNLLPIPALDGGHIAFNLYEFLFKKEVNEAIMLKLTLAGWVILISLMGLGLYNDINRLVG